MTQEAIEKISINNVEYVRADSVRAPVEGNRAVVVVDRGWIFAGNVTRKDGRLHITDAIHVFRWESIGFDGMIASPKSNKVTLKPLAHDVEMPDGSEIFCIPVPADWGK